MLKELKLWIIQPQSPHWRKRPLVPLTLKQYNIAQQGLFYHGNPWHSNINNLPHWRKRPLVTLLFNLYNTVQQFSFIKVSDIRNYEINLKNFVSILT
jgi:hypothetical protein